MEWSFSLFFDAVLANLCDGASDIGRHMLLLVDIDDHCCPISWCVNVLYNLQ